MKKLKVERFYKVTLDWDADMWELYTCSMDCSEVAKTLNTTFMDAVNSGKNREETYEIMYEMMRIFHSYGAFDSEPLYHLDELMDATFGQGINIEN